MRLPREAMFVDLPHVAARGNMVSTLRGKSTNIASRGSHAQSIRGFNRHQFASYASYVDIVTGRCYTTDGFLPMSYPW
jgi:hypothetical protein